MIIFETARLFVRHLTLDDLDALDAICSDPELMSYAGDGTPLPRDLSEKWIHKSIDNYQRYGYGNSAVIAKADQQFIGYCGLVLTPHVSSQRGEAELIYALRKPYWGQGLATELTRAMIDYGFGVHGIKRIVATIAPENVASIRVVEKLGMTYLYTERDEDDLPTAFYAIERP
ncbi:MAG: GNAT family N-acetyltransferase [Anaerolineae bacterium]|nr:GNAT family N-acetyltransferase [Anaerolineae bacterium]